MLVLLTITLCTRGFPQRCEEAGTERIWAALFMLSLTKCKLAAAAKLSLTSSTPGNNICMWTRYLCNDILSPRPPLGWRLPYLDLFFSQIAGWNLMYGKKRSGKRKLIWCISRQARCSQSEWKHFYFLASTIAALIIAHIAHIHTNGIHHVNNW